MKLRIFTGVIYIFILMYIICRLFYCKSREPAPKHDNKEEVNQIELIEVSEQLDKIIIIKEQLYSVEKMITDIEICKPEERATAINISMPTNNTGIQIIANNSSDEVLNLLLNERKKMRSSLANEIKNLQYRCNENCNENYEI